MRRDEIMDAVLKAIKRHVPDDEWDDVTEDTRLVDDLAFDSLDMVETVMDLERELGVAIPDDEAERLFVKGNIKAIIDGLEKLLTNKQGIMGGGIEYGKCEICGNEGPLERTYFYYPVHCDCCGSRDSEGQKRHFVIAHHCERCAPAIPHNIKVTMTDHNGNGYTARIWMKPCEIEGKFNDGIMAEER